MPVAVVALVITGAVGVTVSVRVAWPVPPCVSGVRLIVDVPGAVGVPEISPVPVFTESPAGNPVAPKLVGELVAVI